jgi:lycopene cyclase domain-containing protein
MAGCAAVTLPLEFAFRARVYRRPRRLARAMALPVLAFLAWDAAAIARGTWWFSDRYTTGWRLPLDVPVEEVTFFLVIPVCTLLTFESVTTVLARVRRG